MNNPSEIFDRHRDEIEKYLSSFGLEQQFNNMEIAREAEHEKSLAFFAHEAWSFLPDSPDIRRYPFDELCQMAEQIFS